MSAFLCHFSERQQQLLQALICYEIGRAGKRTPSSSSIVGNVLQGLRRRIGRALSEAEADSYVSLVAGIESHRKEVESYVLALLPGPKKGAAKGHFE